MTWQPRVKVLGNPIEEQLKQSDNSRCCYTRIFVSTLRCCSTGWPMSRSSDKRSASATKKDTLNRARGPADNKSEAHKGVHAPGKYYFCGSSTSVKHFGGDWFNPIQSVDTVQDGSLTLLWQNNWLIIAIVGPTAGCESFFFVRFIDGEEDLRRELTRERKQPAN